MGRVHLGVDVFKAAYDRLFYLYSKGHRLVLSFSGGKDSTVCLELMIMAARDAGRLPVEVIIQDEEISLPGTYEFVEETAARPEVKMSWIVMQHPMINVFNRENPYWWTFDPEVPREKWVREPPSWAEWATDETAIELMTNPLRFPVEKTPIYEDWNFEETKQCLVSVLGLRVAESVKRQLGLYGSGSFMTGSNYVGVFAARPIYDWTDGDVWKFIKETGCKYNRAYDTLYKMGVRKAALRIGPPTLNVAALEGLTVAARAWPRWFDKVANRLPGIRTAVQFGKRTVEPYRKYGETWEQCFYRECVQEAPAWIAERAMKVVDRVLSGHSKHSTAPFPESKSCPSCGMLGSWRILAKTLWGGDPYCQRTAGLLDLVEPKFFRPNSTKTWIGSPEFAKRLQTAGYKLKIPGMASL